MCTVTYVPQNDGFILTSNRDEKKYRPTISPKVYIENAIKLIYPKDVKAGGTWIAANKNGACIVLLNGAFENHQKKQSYRKSRGSILLEVIEAENPVDYFYDLNLNNIEPFTLIVIQKNQLVELKWDESTKYAIFHSISETHIWSSATLYNQEQRSLRKHWFEDFIKKNRPLDEEKIRFFHTNTQPENTEFGLVIDREDKIKTVSISQLIFNKNKIEMAYIDKIYNSPIKKLCFD
jgi:uncharacterized protein with NRDE domain